MINIVNKIDCVGCNACVQRCPKSCITMTEDEQGFIYPTVNMDLCIKCNLCEKVCPVLNQAEPCNPANVYAAKNTNREVKSSSSSGGVFFALATAIISEGGVVFGAKFNHKWDVVHGYAETLDDAKAFQGSKYVQSRIGNCFAIAEQFLKNGRKVLFSGTPCQIAGLKLFLRKEYENLITIDIACHGIPSPLIWNKYLHTVSSNLISSIDDSQNSTFNIDNITFRDKRIGWLHYGLSIKMSIKDNIVSFFEPHEKNIFMKGFLNELFLRPSCYACPVKNGKSHSDLTLADFWGIKKFYPKLYEDEYYSLVLQNSKKGAQYLNQINVDKIPVEPKKAFKFNPSLLQSANKSRKYEEFWSDIIIENRNVTESIKKNIKQSTLRKLYKILITRINI